MKNPKSMPNAMFDVGLAVTNGRVTFLRWADNPRERAEILTSLLQQDC
jgi:hypothetical protein